MVPLVERIANEIADKVIAEINIQTVLRDSPEVALTKTLEARTVLESWHSTYMKVLWLLQYIRTSMHHHTLTMYCGYCSIYVAY